MAFQFLQNIQNGFLSANEIRKIVFSDRQLFLYPVVGAIIEILLFGLFALAAISTILTTGSTLATLAVFFVGYVAIVFVAVFFVVAMLIAFREFAYGKKISFIEGLGRAAQYSTLILEWAIFVSIIKVLLEVLESIIRSALQRYGAIGNIISSLILGAMNLALAVVTLFAIPVIIDEKTGPIGTLKTSAKFIMKNWGEAFGGFAYTEIIYFILIAIGVLFYLFAGLSLVNLNNVLSNPGLIIILLIVLLIMFALSLHPIGAGIVFVALLIYAMTNVSAGALPLILVSIGVILMIAAHLIRYVLFYCFRLVVYDYMTRGTLPKGFDKSVIDKTVIWNPNAGQQQQR